MRVRRVKVGKPPIRDAVLPPMADRALSQVGFACNLGRAAQSVDDSTGVDVGVRFHTLKYRLLNHEGASLKLDKSQNRGMETISERISLVMSESDKMQVELAQIAGTSKANINHLISGKTKAINPVWAYNIERKLGYSARWLLLGEGDRRAVASQTLGDEEARLLTMWRDLPESDRADTLNYIAGRWAAKKLGKKN